MKSGVRIVNFAKLTALISLPWAAVAAPDNAPTIHGEPPASVEEPIKEPVTINPASPPGKNSPLLPNAAPFDSFKLTISDDKKVVHLMGSFRSGISAALKNMLNANPQVEKIILSSGGGAVIDGLAVEKIIRQHGLNTHVELLCASACTEAFQGGKQRTIAATGRLGFHQATQGFLAGLTMAGDERESAPNQLISDLWKRRGISDAFIDQMLATPNRDIWLPTHDGLLAEKIATGITKDSKPGMSPVGKWFSAADMEKELLSGPVWQYARANRTKTYFGSAMMIWIAETLGTEVGDPQELAESVLINTLLKNADLLPDELLLRFITSEHALWTAKPDVLNKKCRGPMRTSFPVAPGELLADRQALLLELLKANETEALVDVKRHKTAQASLIEYWSEMVAFGEYDSDNVTRSFCSEPVNYYDILVKLPVAKRLEYFRALAVTSLHPSPTPAMVPIPIMF